MGTSLFAIANHTYSFENLEETAKNVLAEIEKLNLNVSFFINAQNEKEYDDGEHSYYIRDFTKDKDAYPPVCIEIESPSNFSFTLYESCIEIYTIYRYALIYKNYKIDWFQDFRKDLYRILQIFGGNEIIYLADNSSSLSKYLEGMVFEGISYDEVKAALIQDFGAPVTDYSKLDYETLEYRNLKEFFLDDFRDLK